MSETGAERLAARDETRTIPLLLPDDLHRAYEVVKELRPHLSEEEFSRLAKLAKVADGYRLIARESKGELLAVMGYRILHDLVHGSHVYVDDLVTKSSSRSLGHGAELLRFAEAEARRLGLTGLRLSTGIENEGARKFYEREGWEMRSSTFTKKVMAH
jgi:ribosomal protein S18 acetylase RimI-like enzyme